MPEMHSMHINTTTQEATQTLTYMYTQVYKLGYVFSLHNAKHSRQNWSIL